MKTPDEIKKGLECCHVGDCECDECTYQRNNSCMHWLKQDALVYIQQLERERDALILYAKDDGRCGSCKHIGNSVAAENALQCPNNGRCDTCEAECVCAGCDYFSKWEFDWSFAEDAVQRFGKREDA